MPIAEGFYDSASGINNISAPNANVNGVRVTVWSVRLNSFQLEEGNTPTAYEDYVIEKIDNAPLADLKARNDTKTNSEEVFFLKSRLEIEEVNSVKKSEMQVDVGKNKLNILDYIENSFIGQDGLLVGNQEGFRTSKPINIPLGLTGITISNPNKDEQTWSGTHRYRFLDASGELIQGSLGEIRLQTTLPITVPVQPTYKAFQITLKRVTDSIDSYKELQVEFADVATSFEPYSEKVVKIGGKKIGNADLDILSKSETRALLTIKADEISQDGRVVRTLGEVNRTYTEVPNERVTNYGVGSGYYAYSTGVLTASTARKAVSFDLRGLDPSNLAIDAVVNGSTSVAVVVYNDDEGNFLGYQERVQSGRVDFQKFKLNPPAKAAFANGGNNNGEPIPRLYTYSEEVVYKNLLFTGDVYSKEESNPLLNKCIFGFGDSIMAGDGNGGIGPTEMIIARNKMTGRDWAVGGATMGVSSSEVNNIIAQLNRAIASGIIPDYVIFNGGTNDMVSSKGIPLGNVTSGYTNTFDTSTYCGGFEFFIKTVKTIWPLAKVSFIKPHKIPSRGEEIQNTIWALADTICKKWSTTIVDIYNEGNLNSHIPEMVLLFTAATEAQPYGDRTHPNKLGYEHDYVPKIEAKLKCM